MALEPYVCVLARTLSIHKARRFDDVFFFLFCICLPFKKVYFYIHTSALLLCFAFNILVKRNCVLNYLFIHGIVVFSVACFQRPSNRAIWCFEFQTDVWYKEEEKHWPLHSTHSKQCSKISVALQLWMAWRRIQFSFEILCHPM